MPDVAKTKTSPLPVQDGNALIDRTANSCFYGNGFQTLFKKSIYLPENTSRVSHAQRICYFSACFLSVPEKQEQFAFHSTPISLHCKLLSEGFAFPCVCLESLPDLSSVLMNKSMMSV